MSFRHSPVIVVLIAAGKWMSPLPSNGETIH